MGITPQGINKKVRDMIDGVMSSKAGKDAAKELERRDMLRATGVEEFTERDLAKRIKQLEKQMFEAAKNLEFEQAARLRDQLGQLKERAFGAVPQM
jgi:excinuclease ABC subunit B